MRSLYSILACLVGLCATNQAWSAVVLLDQTSQPAGFVAQSAYVNTPSNTLTVIPPVEISGYHFTHWTINGVRRNDFTGRALNPVPLTIYEDTYAVAQYVPVNQDNDADGLPDWYEIQLYGNLSHAPSDDTDADGYDLATEFQRDYHPLIGNEVVPGGVSMRTSDATLIILDPSLFVYRETSYPQGLIMERMQVVSSNTVMTTVNPPLETLGQTFAFWEVNGQRVSDAFGIARSPCQLLIKSNINAVAHFVPTAADMDGDGIPDWYEWKYLGSVSNPPESDLDGDGIPLRQEFQWDYSPMISNSVIAGGVSLRTSDLVPIVLSNFWLCTIRSDPPGLLAQEDNYVPTGTVVTTPNLHGESQVQTFAYWAVNGQLQAGPFGIPLSQVSFLATNTMDVVAHFVSTGADTDADGILDWYEWQACGTLNYGPNDDPDSDGLTLIQEYALDLPPTIPTTIEVGGISMRLSDLLPINLQPFEQLEYLLMNGVLTNFFSANPPLPGSVAFGTNVAPALGDWDGDGDLDLFVASATGSVRVFQNIGSRYTMDLSERTANFAGLAPAWSGIASPALALGDWSGDGKADMVVGGNGGTIRMISSTGSFGAAQSPAVNYVIATGSTVAIPALADVTGDGRLDLLVLLGDGTVRVYPRTGSSTMPYDGGTFTENLLGGTVPAATGISAADINYDGRPDVLVSDVAGRIWEFHQASTGGSFTLQSKVWAGSAAGFANRLTVAAGDVDGDGDIDVIGGFSEGGLVNLRDPRLAVPANLRAHGGVRSIQLTWDPDRQSRIVGYYVSRSAGNTNSFARLTNALVTLPRFEDPQPVASVTNFYQVTAVSAVNYPGNSVPIYIEGRPSDIAGARVGGVTLWMPDYFGKAGANTILHLNTLNAAGISATNLDLRVTYDPAILTPLSQVDSHKTTVELTALTKRLHITDNAATANGELIITGLRGGVLSGWGSLFDLNFRVAPGAVLGTHTTNTFSQMTLQDAFGNAMPVDATDIAVMTVARTYCPGHVNGDEDLSMADFDLAMKLAVKHRPPTPNELAAGDMNGNGEIDKDDAHLILRLIHGKDPNPKSEDDGPP